MKERNFRARDKMITIAENEQTNGSNNDLSDKARLDLLYSIMANAPLLIWAVDLNGKLLLCEGKGLKSIGHDSDGCEGLSLLEIHKDTPKFKRMLQRSLDGESFCATAKTKMGTKGIAFENWQGPLHGPNGEIIGAAGVAVDITHKLNKRRKTTCGQKASIWNT